MNDPNPFAVVVMAHWQTQVAHRQPQAQYAAKLQVARAVYE